MSIVAESLNEFHKSTDPLNSLKLGVYSEIKEGLKRLFGSPFITDVRFKKPDKLFFRQYFTFQISEMPPDTISNDFFVGSPKLVNAIGANHYKDYIIKIRPQFVSIFKDILNKPLIGIIESTNSDISRINEKSISDITIKDIINNKTLKHYLSDNFNNELFMHTYAYENNLNLEDLGDPDEWANSAVGKDWISYEIESRAQETINKFYYNIIGDKKEIPIWRAMTVEDEWLSHLLREGNRIGHYWSWDFKGAETHWGNYSRKTKVVLESSIKEEHIDWVDTIRLNMNPISEGEMEIRLFKNTPLRIKRIWINNKEIEVPDEIKTKTFKA